MKFAVVLFGLTLSLSSPAYYIDEPWTGASDPLIMSAFLKRNFEELPLKGEAGNGQQFWSGDYWALKKGNINYRWNSRRDKGFKLKSPTREEAMRLSTEELAALAPSEKYDIFVGRFDYPLKTEVATKVANRRADDWEGICHGWAPATMNHNEPLPKTLVSLDGIAIPFGSSDIKALISYYYANGFQVENTHQMGVRCFDGEMSRKCKQDLNAGAFHIVLANKIGLEKVGFIADMDKGKEVWNHPIKGYESKVVGDRKPRRESAPGTMKIVKVKTKVFFINESENFWEPVIGTKHQDELEAKFEYELDINAMNEIVGGKWTSSERPDFLWTKRRPFLFEGNLSRLGELLND